MNFSDGLSGDKARPKSTLGAYPWKSTRQVSCRCIRASPDRLRAARVTTQRLPGSSIGMGVSMTKDATVREAVAVMEDVDSLEAAVEDLKQAGFAEADVSLLAGHATVEKKLGRMYARVEELEDDPTAPRRAFVSTRTVEHREKMVIGSMTTLPTLIAAGTVVASAGAVAVAIGGTAVTGALIGNVLARWMDKRHAAWLEEQLERGGILLWVRTPDESRERQALAILSRHAAHDIHIHEIPEPED